MYGGPPPPNPPQGYGNFAPPSQTGMAPQFPSQGYAGAPPAPPGPPSSAAGYPQSTGYGAPPGQPGAPISMQPQYGSSVAAPPPPPSQFMGVAPPPSLGVGAYGSSAPPPPPSQYMGGPPSSSIPVAPKSVQFFSMASGTPTPNVVPVAGPPPSNAPPAGPPAGSYGQGYDQLSQQQQQPPQSMGGYGMPTGNIGAPPSMGMGMGMGAPPAPAIGPPNGMGPPSMGIPPPPGTMGMGMGMAPPPMMAPPGSMPGIPGQPPIQQQQEQYAGQMYGAPPPNSMVGMPSAFDSGASGGMGMGMYNNQQGLGVGVGGLQPPGASGASPPGSMSGPGGAEAVGGPTLPSIDEMDLSIVCNPDFLRSTTGKILNSQGLSNAARVPLGVICKPMAGDVGIENPLIDVVDFGSTGIVRCKRCRTYINPFVSWVDNGRRWRCNICGILNDVPTSYFSHLDQNGQRRDKEQRPELSRCSVEFIAPGDYMVRPPVPPVYFFVIDVSSTAGSSGMLQSCVNAIKSSLDQLPGSSRTQIGFITFDTTIHFYNLKASLQAPQMLVVSDVTDVILPLPEDLLVNVHESRKVVDALLDALPSMFQSNSAVNNCTGPALQAAKRIVQHVGGKLLLFQTSLPTIGEGTLKPRDNPRLLGTDKEHTLLHAEEAWYKNNAIDFNRLQVCVDTFLFSGQYTDLATLAVLSKYTSGCTYYYPGFQGPRDGQKFESELHRCLTRATGFEAVMRIRATKGLKITNFYGNYFVRGTDLLSLPNCTADSVFGFDMAYEDPVLSATAITIQAALLYSSSEGERRIRVHTCVLPVTASVSDFVDSVDIDATINLLAKQSVDVAMKTGLDTARSRIHQSAVEMIRGAKNALSPQSMGGQPYGAYPQQAPQQAPQQTAIPLSLQLLPLYAMSLQKCLALRGGNDVRTDERAFYLQLLSNMSVDESRVFIYPRMFSIHDMAGDVGIPSDAAAGEEAAQVAGPDRVRLPAILNLSHERLQSDSCVLMETGNDMFMWVGRSVSPAIVSTLFNVQTLEGCDMSQVVLHAENSDFSSRVNAVVEALRASQARYMQLHIIREGDSYAEAYFARFLMEDRATFTGGTFSYGEYHTYVLRQVSGMP